MKIKYKRLAAYIIDFFIINLFMTLVTSSGIFAKAFYQYNDATERLNNLYQDVLKLDEESLNDKVDDMKAIVYDVNNFGSLYFSIEVIVMIGYFVVFQYFNKGQTLGKKFLKIKVVSRDDEELSLGNFLLRSMILYGLIFTIINMILVQLTSDNIFYNLYTIVGLVNIVVTYSTYFMIIFRKDERGLHDMIASSKVVEVNSKNI